MASRFVAIRTLLDTIEDRAARIFEQLVAGKSHLPRIPLAKEQPCAQMPKPARPQPPEVQIDGPRTERSSFRNTGPGLIPTQAAVNSFTKLKFEAPAIAPPHQPFPVPNLTTESCSPRGAEFWRRNKQKWFGRKRSGRRRRTYRLRCSFLRRCGGP